MTERGAENGNWRYLRLPVGVWEQLKEQLRRVVAVQGHDSRDFDSEDKKVRTRTRIASVEYGLVEILRNLSEEEIKMLLGKKVAK